MEGGSPIKGISPGISLLKHSASLISISAFLAVIIGLTYILNLYGLTNDASPTSAFWGWMAVVYGAIAILTMKPIERYIRLRKIVLSIDLLSLVLLQLPPVFLWFLFSGKVVSDSHEGPVGHWIWSVPHIILALVAAYSLYHLFLRETT